MHLGSARWTYPLVSVAVCVAVLLLGQRGLSPPLVTACVLAAAGLGFLVGARQDGLRALSAIDPLTGLHNRRHFEDGLRRELARAHRDQLPLSMLIIDLDELKTINDALGHGAGDRAIRAVAEALKHTCRAQDLVARWGGDEFVVVAPATSEAQAWTLAERIVATVHLRSAGRPPRVELEDEVVEPPLSVSVGLVSADAEHQPALLRAEPLFAAADRALYQAKAQGKGRVHAASGDNRGVVRALRPVGFGRATFAQRHSG